MGVQAVVLEDIKVPTKFSSLRSDRDHGVALGEDHLIRLWKLNNQDLTQPAILLQAKYACALAFKVPFVVIGLESSDLQIWDTRTGFMKALPTGMTSFIDEIHIAFIGKAVLICASSGDEIAVIIGQDDQYTPGIILRPFDREHIIIRKVLSVFQG